MTMISAPRRSGRPVVLRPAACVLCLHPDKVTEAVRTMAMVGLPLRRDIGAPHRPRLTTGAARRSGSDSMEGRRSNRGSMAVHRAGRERVSEVEALLEAGPGCRKASRVIRVPLGRETENDAYLGG